MIFGTDAVKVKWTLPRFPDDFAFYDQKMETFSHPDFKQNVCEKEGNISTEKTSRVIAFLAAALI